MTSAPLSLRRKLLFGAIVSLLAAASLLVPLEIALRLADYGYSPSFVRRAAAANGEFVWRENRWATAPFFSPELVRRPLPFRLPATKSPGTYRIFVLGSSAAMGDPEPSFSIARMLETMLRTAYPGLRFEVINAGITAINSHVVRGIAADCAKLEPDLFIIYEGNNEVIGPFGPAGVFAPFVRQEILLRAAVWLKRTRTGQLFTSLARTLSGQRQVAATWGGMQMFTKQQIAASDPRLKIVQTHFRANLNAIAESAHHAGAASLFCTVATNERDFAPFLSQHRAGLSAEELLRWQAEVNAAEAAARSHDLSGAETHYRNALKVDDEYAEIAFQLGRLLLQTGNDGEARPLLARARDLDTLRFRTDSSLNDVVRNLHAPGASVIDVAAALAERSAHGIVGDEFLYEHVHLTLRGAYEIALELFSGVAADLARRQIAAGTTVPPPSYNEARLRLGFTAHEQAMIALELLNRFKSPPFSQQADHVSRLTAWQRRVDTLTTLLARPDATPALREIYQHALSIAPDDWILARNAGSMFVARQLPAEALPLLQRAASVIDDDVDTLVATGWAQRAQGHAAEADAAFAKARVLEPRYPGLPKEPAPAP